MYNEPESVVIKGKVFRKLLDSQKIDNRIAELADSINKDYAKKNITLLVVLKGGMPFAAELMKFIKPECTLQFVRASSYGAEMESCGEVKLQPFNFEISGRHILIIEDIADSGRTLRRLVDEIYDKDPADVAIVTLCKKPKKLMIDLPIKYNCFEIEEAFVVGFGMDYDEIGRNYPAIYQLK